MTLDEAIKRAREIALEMKREATYNFPSLRGYYQRCGDCAEEHEQLADWLEELKQLREESKWIPVTWREATENDTPYLDEYPIVLTCPMPDDRQEILISDHGYVCTDVCQIDSQGYWLEGKDDWLDIDAWMPLPKPYKAEDSDFD